MCDSLGNNESLSKSDENTLCFTGNWWYSLDENHEKEGTTTKGTAWALMVLLGFYKYFLENVWKCRIAEVCSCGKYTTHMIETSSLELEEQRTSSEVSCVVNESLVKQCSRKAGMWCLSMFGPTVLRRVCLPSKNRQLFWQTSNTLESKANVSRFSFSFLVPLFYSLICILKSL